MRSTLTTTSSSPSCCCTLRRHPALTVSWSQRPIVRLKSAPRSCRRLAQAFYPTDAARQRSTGGVGLGLNLCRLIAQAHGGKLTVKNANPGLEVRVTLALAVSAGPSAPG